MVYTSISKSDDSHFSQLLDQTFTTFLLGLSIFLQADGINTDETSGVLRGEVTNLIHGALNGIIQVGRVGPAPKDTERALVSPAAHGAIYIFLRGNDALRQELALGRKVHAVVQQLGKVERDELVTECAHLAVQDKTLEVHVRGAQHGQAGSLVAAARLESNEAILDNVDTTNSIPAGNGIGSQKQVDRVCGRLFPAFILELDG